MKETNSFPTYVHQESNCCFAMQEEFEDNKRVICIRISKKNRQHNGYREKGQKDKQRSTKHTHKTKDRITRTPLKTGMNSGAPKGLAVPAPPVAPVVLIYQTYQQGFFVLLAYPLLYSNPFTLLSVYIVNSMVMFSCLYIL